MYNSPVAVMAVVAESAGRVLETLEEQMVQY